MYSLLYSVLNVFEALIVIRALLSWFGSHLRHPAIELLERVTEPLLAAIRKVVPPVGGFDLSPLLAIVGIQLLRGFL